MKKIRMVLIAIMIIGLSTEIKAQKTVQVLGVEIAYDKCVMQNFNSWFTYYKGINEVAVRNMHWSKDKGLVAYIEITRKKLCFGVSKKDGYFLVNQDEARPLPKRFNFKVGGLIFLAKKNEGSYVLVLRKKVKKRLPTVVF